MMYGILLLVFSAFIHASWNALIKKMDDKATGLFLVAIVATLTSVFLAPFTGGFNSGSHQAIVYSLIAGVFEGFYLITLTQAFEKAPLGVAYAIMRGGAMLLVWFVSALYLGEKVSLASLVCVSLVLVGLALVPPRHPSAKLSTALWWAVGAAICIAGYHLFYGAALREGSSQVMVFMMSIIVSVPILGMRNKGRAFKRAFSMLRQQPAVVVGCGVMNAVSFILFLYGLSSTAAGMAITFRNTSVVFAQLLALLLGERPTALQWFGIFLITGGAALLGWA